MAEPFLAEIRIIGFGFAPPSWAFCDGQIVPISQNQSLFSILGTNYGGDGTNTFGLPDLRGRAPMHAGPAHTLGQRGGEEAHTLMPDEMPAHTHQLRASGDTGNQALPASDRVLATSPATDPGWTGAANLVPMDAGVVGGTGGSAHENMQPFLTLNFIIAVSGIFPPQN